MEDLDTGYDLSVVEVLGNQFGSAVLFGRGGIIPSQNESCQISLISEARTTVSGVMGTWTQAG
jgi:hypothetical protein